MRLLLEKVIQTERQTFLRTRRANSCRGFCASEWGPLDTKDTRNRLIVVCLPRPITNWPLERC
jgi:hypothetical protein